MTIVRTSPQFAAALVPLALAGASCVASPDVPGTPKRLAEPNIVMVANPAPPFTYWAPDGSTVRNHPEQPGIWIATTADGSRKFYFGDRCRASDYQDYLGRSVDVLPEKPDGALWRMACSTCVVESSLAPQRMNVTYDQQTRIINEISCG